VTPIYSGIQPFHSVSFLWLLPALPAAGALLLAVAGRIAERRLGRRVVAAVAIGAVVAAALVALVAVAGVLLRLPPGERALVDARGPIAAVDALQVSATLTLDRLAGLLALLVTVGAALTLICALPRAPGWRYFFAMDLGVAAMLLVVLADNILVLFTGWEGIALCSYLLIGFERGDPRKVAGASRAFIVNRAGDCVLFGAVALLLAGMAAGGPLEPQSRVMVDVPGGAGVEVRTLGDRPHTAALREVEIGPTLSARGLRDQVTMHDVWLERPFARELAGRSAAGLPLVLLVCLGLFVGAAAKAGQVPFAGWMRETAGAPPAAAAFMNSVGPPAAGAYLLARFSFLFALAPTALAVVAIAGAVTALAGAFAALAEDDLARVLALSTVSQLGLAFVAFGCGDVRAGVLQLAAHAAIKACLFLAAAAGARRAYLIAALALAGLPPASGFFAQRALLSAVWHAPEPLVIRAVLWLLVIATVGLTALYAARSTHRLPEPEPDQPAPSRAAIGLLAVGAVVVGPLLRWPPALRGGGWALAGVITCLAALGWLAAPSDGAPRASWGRLAGDDAGTLYRQLGVAPAFDLARLAAFVDRRLLEPIAGAVAGVIVRLARLLARVAP
jgi:NADH-quinone oxidoreductase subunit L